MVLAACAVEPVPTPAVATAPTAAPEVTPTAEARPATSSPKSRFTPTSTFPPRPTLTSTATPVARAESVLKPTAAPNPTPTPTPVRPRLPDVDSEKVFYAFFDIESGSGPGSEVIGRINLERNRNAANSSIPDDYRFVMIEDDSAGMFELRNQRDSSGRLFGVFSVADGKTARTGGYSLRVELRQGATVLARFTSPVAVAERTRWDIYYERAVDFVARNGRLTGRRNYADSQVAGLIDELEANNGAFSDLKFYGATSHEARRAIGEKTLGEQLEEAANRIGGLGKAYLRSSTYGPPGLDGDRDRLRNAIYLALIAYVDHFPVDDFGNTDALLFTDRTHQWEFSDPISGAAVLIYQDLIRDRNDGIQRAGEVKGRLFRFLQQVNFDLPENWRLPSHNRYYLANQLG